MLHTVHRELDRTFRSGPQVRLSAVALLVLAIAPSASQAQSHLPPGSTVERVVEGESEVLSIGDWGLEWWKWILSFPASTSPATDVTGSRQNRGQIDPVFFMCAAAGPAAGFATRTFAVPEGQHLLIATSTIGSVPDLGEEPVQLCQNALALLGGTSALSVAIDGVPIPQADLFAHLESSGFDTVTVAPGNPFNLNPGVWDESCAHGYFVMLEPLPLGQHTIECGFSNPGLGIFLQHTNVITVVSPKLFYDRHVTSTELSNVQDVALSGDGRHLYAASIFNDSVAVYEVASTTGALTFVEVEQDAVAGVDGLNGAQALAIVPSDSLNPGHLYVASSTDDAIAVFERDATTGELTFVEVQRDGAGGLLGLDGASAVTVAPDGQHVYAVGLISDAVVTFERNPATGALTFVDALFDDDARQLDGAKGLAVSPDGAHVYVAASVEDAIAVLGRDQTTGVLTYLGAAVDGVSGIDGLDEASAVVLDPSGAHVYVAAAFDDAVAVFERNGSTGTLSFVEFHQPDTSGTPGLIGANSVAVAPNGEYVYVASFDDEAVTLFQRNASTGALTFVDILQDETYGVDGMAGARGLALSPNGVHGYVAGSLDNAVATFIPEPEPATLFLPASVMLLVLSRRRAERAVGEGTR